MQACDKAGSLEIVGKVLPDEIELPDLEGADHDEPEETQREGEELVGTPDAEELVLADIGGGPEEIGLDAETYADERGDQALSAELLDADDGEEGEGARWALDEKSLEFEEDLGLDEEEERWTEDSEGMGSALEDSFDLDDEDGVSDDGGLEGVEDPSMDGLALDEDEDDEVVLPLRDEEDEDEDEDDESLEDFGDEFSVELTR